MMNGRTASTDKKGVWLLLLKSVDKEELALLFVLQARRFPAVPYLTPPEATNHSVSTRPRDTAPSASALAPLHQSGSSTSLLAHCTRRVPFPAQSPRCVDVRAARG